MLLNPRAVRLAAAGFSDLAGLTSETITTDMVGQNFARFVGIETKFGRRQATDEQRAFLAMVTRLGGRAGIARSVDDSAEILGV